MHTIFCRSVLAACVVFFFSSRRRHTRLVSDWSSDVCSSDLGRRRLEMQPPQHGHQLARDCRLRANEPRAEDLREAPRVEHRLRGDVERAADVARSEERHVGKEGRYRRSADDLNKKTEEATEL